MPSSHPGMTLPEPTEKAIGARPELESNIVPELSSWLGLGLGLELSAEAASFDLAAFEIARGIEGTGLAQVKTKEADAVRECSQTQACKTLLLSVPLQTWSLAPVCYSRIFFRLLHTTMLSRSMATLSKRALCVLVANSMACKML